MMYLVRQVLVFFRVSLYIVFGLWFLIKYMYIEPASFMSQAGYTKQ
jgi:hypothetical protein